MTSLRVIFLGFRGGDPEFLENNIIIEQFKDGDRVVNTMEEANVVVMGCFLEPLELTKVISFKGLRVLWVTEPFHPRFSFTLYSHFIYRNKIYDFKAGCVENDREKCSYKYPLYIDILKKHKLTSDVFEKVNEDVSKRTIEGKRFSTLISRHDIGNGRGKVCNVVSKYGEIDCPGQLFNNMSNQRVNTIGIPEFVKDYIFNICNENFGNSHDGYITEKIMNCCLGGAIPIYYGKLDDIDKKIFNIDRILEFQDADNLEGLVTRLTELQDSDKLMSFYRKEPFMPTAKETFDTMKNNIRDLIEDLRNKLIN